MRPHHVDPLETPSTLRRPGYPEQLGPGYDPGAWDAPGVVAFSDVAVPAGTGQGSGPMLRPCGGMMVACLRSTMTSSPPCGGCGSPSVPFEVVEVISNDPAAAPDESMQGRGWPTGAHDP
jgi:hypothetical protein